MFWRLLQLVTTPAATMAVSTLAIKRTASAGSWVSRNGCSCAAEPKRRDQASSERRSSAGHTSELSRALACRAQHWGLETQAAWHPQRFRDGVYVSTCRCESYIYTYIHPHVRVRVHACMCARVQLRCRQGWRVAVAKIPDAPNSQPQRNPLEYLGLLGCFAQLGPRPRPHLVAQIHTLFDSHSTF
jgi:hypothetical protein